MSPQDYERMILKGYEMDLRAWTFAIVFGVLLLPLLLLLALWAWAVARFGRDNISGVFGVLTFFCIYPGCYVPIFLPHYLWAWAAVSLISVTIATLCHEHH